MKQRTLDLLSAWAAGLALLGSAAVAVTYATVPAGSAGPGPVDVLLVLGAPATVEGGPSQVQRWRVEEAVQQYRAGQAQHILFSGGAVANRFAEADVMARLAISLGVPAGAVLEDREAETTVQNISNSERILDAHGWHRVEVISSEDHLRRAAVLLARTHLVWRVQPASTVGKAPLNRFWGLIREAIGTSLLRWFGPAAAEPVNHFAARLLRFFGRGLSHFGVGSNASYMTDASRTAATDAACASGAHSKG